MKLNWNKPEGEEWKAYEITVLAVNAFQRNAAPLAFTWLGWCGILALIRFAELRTGLWPFTALTWLLGVLLWGYFGSLFWGSEKAEWLSREAMLARKRWVNMILSLAATAGLVAASYWIADVFMRHPL